MKKLPRFQFIGHALLGDGGFRPVVTYDGSGNPVTSGSGSYLVRYPRESEPKFARRCELAFYASPLARVTSKFVAHIASKTVIRVVKNNLLQIVHDDVDGKGNSSDVFWQDFMVDAKARGSMLLLVDMPNEDTENLQTQLDERIVPHWTKIAPELLVDYEIADDGKFNFAEFKGAYKAADGEVKDCTWYFDREKWEVRGAEGKVVSGDEHGLSECPLMIFTESGGFPCYGSFAPVADLSKRLFNLDSELDEILRSQTFSLLTMQVPDDTSDAQRLEAAKNVGETIGTSNLMMHSGSTPAFIAPEEGPANVYLERIKDIRLQISEVGLDVATINQQESGIAMQLRFQSINAELGRFAVRMEDFERRVWSLTSAWLKLTEDPQVAWPRDFNVADPEKEIDILRGMQETAMPQHVITAQQKKVVAVQFNGLDPDEHDELIASLDQVAL